MTRRMSSENSFQSNLHNFRRQCICDIHRSINKDVLIKNYFLLKRLGNYKIRRKFYNSERFLITSFRAVIAESKF